MNAPAKITLTTGDPVFYQAQWKLWRKDLSEPVELFGQQWFLTNADAASGSGYFSGTLVLTQLVKA